MSREKILKDLARSLKVEIGQKFRILTKPFENDVLRITNDTLELNGEAFIYFDTGLLSQLMFGYHKIERLEGWQKWISILLI